MSTSPRHLRYSFGVFELDPVSRRLVHGEKSIHITTKPFNVLVHLIENRDRLVTRQELLERIWGRSDVYDEALTKCIESIRKSLGDNSKEPRYIYTHWSEGYKFIGNVVELEQAPAPISETPVPAVANNLHSTAETVRPRANLSRLSIFRRRTSLAVAISVLLLLSAGAWGLLHLRASSHKPVQINSVAILPLKNLSGDPANDYLCDGITESLISSIARIRDLKVISRSSAFAADKKALDTNEVGTQLGVESVILGSLQRQGDGLRVNVRLVKSDTGEVIWSADDYELTVDIFRLQDSISRDIATRLRPRFAGDQSASVSRRYTKNPEAHRLYLKGRFLWNRRTAEDVIKALDLFQQSIQEDPEFALGYVGVADCYALMSSLNGLPSDETFPKAKLNLLKALSLDDQIAEAHATLGLIAVWYELDWRTSGEEYRRAIALNPNYETARHWYGLYLALAGKPEEGLVELTKAQELDPLSLIIRADLALGLQMSGHHDEAVALYQSTLNLDPNFAPAHFYLGWTFLKAKQTELAVESIRRAVNLSKDNLYYKAMLGYALGRTGERIEAGKILQTISEPGKASSPSYKAMVYMGLGDRKKAMSLLEQAFSQHDHALIDLKVSPVFDDLHGDPIFENLLSRIGFAQG